MASILQEVFVVSAARTPIGSFRSGLAALTAPQLGSIAIRGAVDKTNIPYDKVFFSFLSLKFSVLKVLTVRYGMYNIR